MKKLIKANKTGSRKRQAESNDQSLLDQLFAKGDERAENARKWLAALHAEQQAIVIEVAAGGAIDAGLRAAMAKGRLGPAEAAEILKLAKAVKPPGKGGRNLLRRTLEQVQGIAWLRVHEPGLSRYEMAKRMGIGYEEFRTFVRQHKDLIDGARKLLLPPAK